jgi:hypothetical protein
VIEYLRVRDHVGFFLLRVAGVDLRKCVLANEQRTTVAGDDVKQRAVGEITRAVALALNDNAT